MIRRIVGLAGAAILCTTAAARAQTVSGQVVEATSGAAVGRGFVVLLGADGKEVSRTLSDNAGRFTLRAPAPGPYRLRSERIAYRLTTSPTIELAAGVTVEYRLEVSAVPIRLEEIRVAGDTKCRIRPEEGRASATVWEEARKALTAAAWIQNQQRLRAQVRTWERELDLQLRVIRETSRVYSGSVNRAFRALSPRELAEQGYIQKTADGGLLFQGPDAEALFSDEFLNRHCFRLEPPGEDEETAGLVGLAFQPEGGGKLPDISGVIWLDEKSAELRFVEFRYERHDLPMDTDLAGGRVDFEQLTNGAWIVRRFWIRMPHFTTVSEQRITSIGRDFGQSREVRNEVSGLTEQGGEVVEAFASDGTRLAAALGSAVVEGAVFDSTRGIPLIGARVSLSGTSYAAVSGPDGRFRLENVPDGTYGMEFSHPDFPAWGTLGGPATVTVKRGGVTPVALAVPPAQQLFRRICPDVAGDTLGAVAGVVRDQATAAPVRDAVVQLGWRTYTGGNAVLTGRLIGIEAGTDEKGYFRGCGLPAGQTIEARVFIRGQETGLPVELRVLPLEIHELLLTR